jgi:hypothetical protein
MATQGTPGCQHFTRIARKPPSFRAGMRERGVAVMVGISFLYEGEECSNSVVYPQQAAVEQAAVHSMLQRFREDLQTGRHDLVCEWFRRSPSARKQSCGRALTRSRFHTFPQEDIHLLTNLCPVQFSRKESRAIFGH